MSNTNADLSRAPYHLFVARWYIYILATYLLIIWSVPSITFKSWAF